MSPRKRPAESPPEQTPALEDAVAGLTDQVGALADQVHVLRVAIDDLREELQFAIRNLPREPWVSSPPLTSMPKDPLAENFVINRTKKEDLPPENMTMTAEATSRQKEAPPDSQPKPQSNGKLPEGPSSATSPRSKPASKKRVRLDLKIYFDSAYADLVRFIGYDGKPLDDVRTFVQKLEKKHGRDKVKEAGDAIAVIDGRAEPHTVRLKDEVRRLAVQMLGAPPESKQPT